MKIIEEISMPNTDRQSLIKKQNRSKTKKNLNKIHYYPNSPT